MTHIDPSDEALRAALLLDEAASRGPRFLSGTATSSTDDQGDTEVLLDLPTVTSTADEDTGEDDPADPNPPVAAQTVAGPVAEGERVAALSIGTAVVLLGSMGGQARLIGAAAIEGGTTDVPVVSTDATELGLLRAETTVTHPNHLIAVLCTADLSSAAGSNTLTGRIRREDPDGTDSEVGRFLRAEGLANGQRVMAFGGALDWGPDPGSYDYYPTVQAASGGFTTILDPNTTPAVAAWLVVYDLGPLPQGAVLS